MIRIHDGSRDEDGQAGDDGGDDDGFEKCPRCGRLLFDEMVRCPRCGYDDEVDEPRPTQPWWVKLGAFACLAMMVYWILHF